MNFRIVLHGELSKSVAIGVFDEQELAVLSAARILADVFIITRAKRKTNVFYARDAF